MIPLDSVKLTIMINYHCTGLYSAKTNEDGLRQQPNSYPLKSVALLLLQGLTLCIG